MRIYQGVCGFQASQRRRLENSPLTKVDAVLGKRQAKVGKHVRKGMAMMRDVTELDEHRVWKERARGVECHHPVPCHQNDAVSKVKACIHTLSSRYDFIMQSMMQGLEMWVERGEGRHTTEASRQKSTEFIIKCMPRIWKYLYTRQNLPAAPASPLLADSPVLVMFSKSSSVKTCKMAGPAGQR